MVNLGYGCCVGSWDRFHRNVQAPLGDDGRIIAVSGQASIAYAYNSILDAYRDSDHDGPVVLLHDDLEITDPDFGVKVHDALRDPDVWLVGVAGGNGLEGRTLAWWDGPTLGHQMTDDGMLDLGRRSGPAQQVEGSLLIIAPHALRGERNPLRWRTDLPGFHGYDEIATVVRRVYGKKVMVADIDTHHHTKLGFSSDASASEWAARDAEYNKLYGWAAA